MRVRATIMSSKLRVKIKELGRIANEGEEFDVSPMRFEILTGKNKFKAIFVEEISDNVIDIEDYINEVEEETKTSEKVETKSVETPKKRGRKPKAKN